MRRLIGAAAVMALCAAPGLRAQAADSARVGPTAPAGASDTLSPALDSMRRRPPISPKRAFLQSLLVPGWGQASLRRPTAGGIFVAVEVMSVAMLVQSKQELAAARAAARDSVLVPGGGYEPNPLAGRIRPRRQAVEDWAALLIFNHLLAGADAFVAAHLWNVPIEVGGHASAREARISARVPF